MFGKLKKVKQGWLILIAFLPISLGIGFGGKSNKKPPKIPNRVHVSHSSFFEEPFETPQAVTKACLECHEESASEIMATAHWTWLGQDYVRKTGTIEEDGSITLGEVNLGPQGKKNLLNNFCIGITGNEAKCTSCHIGYGWKDADFDFKDESAVDCLICHDQTGQYRKGSAGMPTPNTDLLAAAKSVSYPNRDNCGVCHYNGGGGMGVKHGDLDSSLAHPFSEDDVHMGEQNMLCIDCHTGGHKFKGRSFAMSSNHEGGIDCLDCHDTSPHEDVRLNQHTDVVACQTCHIPAFATKEPTKLTWDWSKAGDPDRKEDYFEYLKIKGEFTYGQNMVPTYDWFNYEMDHYILGDPIDETIVTDINNPRGGRGLEGSKIWPFKVHIAQQPYDTVYKYLLPPMTSGKNGYWHNFDWGIALKAGAEASNIVFSGSYGFTETVMYWPLSHLVAPSEKSLQCVDCHSEQGRLDWKALGYPTDPINMGGGL